MPFTDNTRDTYGNVIRGNKRFKALRKPLSKAFNPKDLFFINNAFFLNSY